MMAGIWVALTCCRHFRETVKRIVGALAIASEFSSTWPSTARNGKSVSDRPPAGCGAGFASGIISALAHVGGIIFSFYLLPHSRTKEIFVGTTVFLFFTTGC